MKNRVSAGGKPAKEPKPPKTPKEPKGRYARVWLSKEFLAWCKRHHFKPPGGAVCVLHTYSLRNPGTYAITVHSTRPDSSDDLFDLDESGKEPR